MWFESNINKLAKNLFYAAFGTPFQETWGILNINKIRSNTWQGEYFICGVWILGYKRFDCRNLILKNLLFGLKFKKNALKFTWSELILTYLAVIVWNKRILSKTAAILWGIRMTEAGCKISIFEKKPY